MACAVESYDPRFHEDHQAEEAVGLSPVGLSPEEFYVDSPSRCIHTFTLGEPVPSYRPDFKNETESFFVHSKTTWWDKSIAEDVHKTLKEKEASLPRIGFGSPQLVQRIYLVDFLDKVTEHLHLSRATKFLAVTLMDHFMDKHAVMEFRMKLVALTCLQVSAKFDELDDKLPSLISLQRAANAIGSPVSYTKDEFHKMELYLLKFFNWNVFYPTAIDYSGYYLSKAEGPTYMKEGNTHLELCNNHFLEIALRDYNFIPCFSSEIAAAALCAARMYMGAPEPWTAELESLTGCSMQQIHPMVQKMIQTNEMEME